MGARPRIALLVANIIDPFSYSLSKGAVAAAKELGADLTIFPGKYLGIQDKYDAYDTTYEYQYHALFDIAAKGGFDYIICAIGTIAYALNSDQKAEFLKSLGDTPMLVVAADLPGFDCLVFDNRSGISAIMDELAAQGRRHIGLMAGDPRNYECSERVAAYREGLMRNGIPYKEKYVITSDISDACRDEANILLDRNPELDAVVCINDNIAAVVHEILRERGRKVGSEVAVTGFDDLPMATEMSPALATVRADAEGLGARAVEKVLNKLRGCDKTGKLFPTSFVKRASCTADGQSDKHFERLSESQMIAIRQEVNDRIHLDNIFVRDAMMFSADLKTSYAKMLKQLVILGAPTSFVFTLDKPLTHKVGMRFNETENWLFRCYAYGAHTFAVPDSEQRMSLPELFANEHVCFERQHSFIAADLYVADKQYGLALLEVTDDGLFPELELVTYILSSAVRTLDMLQSQDRLLTELHLKNLALENESQTDELTGIYNRRGFYLAAQELFDSKPDDTEFFICYADLDNLKMINDLYGHAEGDSSIKAVAEGLREIFGEGAVVGRMGGDEFAAAVPVSGGADTESLTAARESYISRVNAGGMMPYRFSFSAGIIRTTCLNGYDLKAAMDKADDLLYEQKQKRKKII